MYAMTGYDTVKAFTFLSLNGNRIKSNWVAYIVFMCTERRNKKCISMSVWLGWISKLCMWMCVSVLFFQLVNATNEKALHSMLLDNKYNIYDFDLNGLRMVRVKNDDVCEIN